MVYVLEVGKTYVYTASYGAVYVEKCVAVVEEEGLTSYVTFDVKDKTFSVVSLKDALSLGSYAERGQYVVTMNDGKTLMSDLEVVDGNQAKSWNMSGVLGNRVFKLTEVDWSEVI